MTERIECISVLLSYIKFKVHQYEMKHIMKLLKQYNIFFKEGEGGGEMWDITWLIYLVITPTIWKSITLV
jgi:hypothetical protein